MADQLELLQPERVRDILDVGEPVDKVAPRCLRQMIASPMPWQVDRIQPATREQPHHPTETRRVIEPPMKHQHRGSVPLTRGETSDLEPRARHDLEWLAMRFLFWICFVHKICLLLRV